jgi:hypothetical protein
LAPSDGASIYFDFGDFIELVFKLGVRPDRPDEDEGHQMSDDILALAERCWTKIPRHGLLPHRYTTQSMSSWETFTILLMYVPTPMLLVKIPLYPLYPLGRILPVVLMWDTCKAGIGFSQR